MYVILGFSARERKLVYVRFLNANVSASTCALSYLSRVPSFFSPLIAHEKIQVYVHRHTESRVTG